VIKEMLTKEEIIWLNEYHKSVYDRHSPLLTEEEKSWLKEKTNEI
jgi:Xaa-Pro aminopeptidase